MKKSGTGKVPDGLGLPESVAVESSQDVDQTEEHIEDVDEQVQRRNDVVGFLTVNDVAGVIEDIA